MDAVDEKSSAAMTSRAAVPRQLIATALPLGRRTYASVVYLFIQTMEEQLYLF